MFLDDPKQLEGALAAHKSTYRGNQPFPHAVIDGVFDSAQLRTLASRFPSRDAIAWGEFNKEAENRKRVTSDLSVLHTEIVTFLLELNTGYFLQFLERLTGIEGLIPDPYYMGGGLHVVDRGGWLNVHVDFNRHTRMKVYRRINVLVYLNDPWEDSWGGHLQLYGKHPTSALPGGTPKTVAPLLNRMVVFDTTATSFHGHPEPLACPEGVSRKSIALYYYTSDPGPDRRPEQSTVFYGPAP